MQPVLAIFIAKVAIVDDDVDKSIHNLTSIGAEAMCKTDDMVLSIMTSKKQASPQ